MDFKHIKLNKPLIILVFSILLTLFATACGIDAKKSIIGTWVGKDQVGDVGKISFYDNGTFEMNTSGTVYAGMYTIESNELLFSPKIYKALSDFGQGTKNTNPEITHMKFKFEDTETLTITNTDGDPVNLVKQKSIEPMTLKLDNVDNLGNSVDSSAPQTATEDNNNKTYKMGEPVTIADIEFVVENAVICTGYNYDTNQENAATYLKVTVKATNKRNDFNEFGFENLSVSADGMNYPLNSKATKALNNTELGGFQFFDPYNSGPPLIELDPKGGSSTVNADGGDETGYIYFSTPEDLEVSSYTLNIPVLGASRSENIKIKLDY